MFLIGPSPFRNRTRPHPNLSMMRILITHFAPQSDNGSNNIALIRIFVDLFCNVNLVHVLPGCIREVLGALDRPRSHIDVELA